MNVPFPIDNKLPIKSWSELDEIVQFPRHQMIELSPERTKELMRVAPHTFKVEGDIKVAKPKAETIRTGVMKVASVATPISEEEYNDVAPDSDTTLEDSKPDDVDEGV